MADDRLVVELVAAEPDVNSPVAISWDTALHDRRAPLREQALWLAGPRWAESTALRDAVWALSDDRAVLALSDDRNEAIRFRLALVGWGRAATDN